MIVGLSLVPESSPSASIHTDETDVAVVIDMLRATSVITTALAAGANQVITCVDVDQALLLAKSLQPQALLCGERHCRRIAGFDLGNSPSEYTQDVVGDRTLVMTTTNGTRAIDAAAGAKQILLASFLNLDAVLAKLSTTQNIRIICAGTDSLLTAEDVLLAGAILDSLQARHAATFSDDSCRLAVAYWRQLQAFPGNHNPASIGPASISKVLATEFAKTRGGRNLIAAGYANDLELCAQLNTTKIVPSSNAASPSCFAHR